MFMNLVIINRNQYIFLWFQANFLIISFIFGFIFLSLVEFRSNHAYVGPISRWSGVTGSVPFLHLPLGRCEKGTEEVTERNVLIGEFMKGGYLFFFFFGSFFFFACLAKFSQNLAKKRDQKITKKAFLSRNYHKISHLSAFQGHFITKMAHFHQKMTYFHQKYDIFIQVSTRKLQEFIIQFQVIIMQNHHQFTPFTPKIIIIRHKFTLIRHIYRQFTSIRHIFTSIQRIIRQIITSKIVVVIIFSRF